MPVNWYAALIVIVLLGIGSVVLARYHYAKGASGTEPIVGQTWHAGLAFNICGTAEPALPATASGSPNGLTTTGNGVLLIAPKNSSEAGKNATLGKFATEDATVKITNSSVQYPGGVLYTNGQKCAKGTPDAGQVGVVRARAWTLAAAKSGSEQKLVGGHYTAQPASLRLRNSQLITMGFGPASKPLPKPPASTETALLQVINGTAAPVTTTTPPATTPTTGATATTTTPAPVTTTTKPSAAATTTTTKPSG
jgi:hypothetical protein